MTYPYDDGFEVRISIDTTSEWQPHMWLEHLPHRDGDHEPMRYRVGLQWTRPHYGGIRWWFVCPRDQERCGKLYLPRGGWQFWSREAYRLRYQSQRETALDRAGRRARKVLRKLGGGEYPVRPKWMRHKTYDRLYERWDEAEEQADALLGLRLLSFVKRYS